MIVRTPIERKLWARPDTGKVVMGVDPGFGTGGIVLLEKFHPDFQPKVLHGEIIETSKAAKKERTNLRVTTDDQRRYREIWAKLSEISGTYHPYAVGLEAYRVFEGRGGNAWKTAVVYGGIIFWAHTANLYVTPFLPTDLKKRFCGKLSASKEEVEETLCKLIQGLRELLDSNPKGKREHLADAAGHAYLVMEEVAQHRKLLGLD